MREELLGEFQLFEHVCNEKRQMLGGVASRRARWWRVLGLTSGVLALASAASIVGVFASSLPVTNGQALSAVFAIVSGSVSLIGNQVFDQRETSAFHAGMAVLLQLRERAHMQRLRTDEDDQALAVLKALWSEYSDVAQFCDPLLEGWFSGTKTVAAPESTAPST